MITVKKLKDDLDYWIMIGIADDIVRCPDSRPEYQHLVKKAQRWNENSKVSQLDFPGYWLDIETGRQIDEIEMTTIRVISLLESELQRPLLFRPTFWRLNFLYMKWGCEWLLKKASRGRRMLAGKKEV